MSAINIETFCSGIFHFDVGPSKMRFNLHAKLVSRHSEPLNAMMSGGMKESREGAATLEHVDVDTFAKFAEYVYCGDYSSTCPVTDSVREDQHLNGDYPRNYPANAAAEEKAADYDEWGSILSTKKVKKKKKDKSYSNSCGYAQPEELVEVPQPVELVELPAKAMQDYVEPDPEWYPTPTSVDDKETQGATPFPEKITSFPLVLSPGPNNTSALDYSPTFMSHARVYVFAQEYLIPNLMALAASKLSDVLNIFRCYPRRAGDIANLIRYVYENTPDEKEDVDGCKCPRRTLREIVVRYSSNNFRVLAASAEFKDLLAEGGSFIPDLCGKVAKLL